MSKPIFTPAEMETARLAVEDELIARRDSRIGVVRRNGLCVFERDGEPSPVIRMTIEDAIRIGIDAIYASREASAA